MIWLALVIILAAGVVEAGETGLNIVDANSSVIIECADTEGKLRDCKIHMPELFPCYQRMRDAMAAMVLDHTFLIRPSHGGSIELELTAKFGRFAQAKDAFNKWESTVKDCVHGARP
jgi:hypothetical protein